MRACGAAPGDLSSTTASHVCEVPDCFAGSQVVSACQKHEGGGGEM